MSKIQFKTDIADKRALKEAVRVGDLTGVENALGRILDVEGSAEKRTALLNSLLITDQTSRMSLAVLAVKSFNAERKTQLQQVRETTNAANAYAAGANRITQVQSMFGELELSERIQARLEIVQTLVSAGVDLLNENSIPTFLEAANDIRINRGSASIANFNGDPNNMDGILQDYSRRLVMLVNEAQASRQQGSQRISQADRKKEYGKYYLDAHGDETGTDESHPLLIAVTYGTIQNVRDEIRNLFAPKKNNAYMTISYGSANALPQYIPTRAGSRNKLTSLMQKVLLTAIELWTNTKASDSFMRPLTERVLLAVVGAVSNQVAIGNVDEEGWNAMPNTVMDNIWRLCQAALQNGNLIWDQDFNNPRNGARTGTLLINQLCLGNNNNVEFSGLRFTPSPPGPRSTRRLLTLGQEEFVANIKSDFLNNIGIPQQEHQNWIWCCVAEDTLIYEQSNYFTSRQSMKQYNSAYDKQGIKRGSICLCEFGPPNATQHNQRLNYSFADWFDRETYCRVIRAWDYVEYDVDNSARNVALGGLLGSAVATTASYYVPDLLFNASFLSALVATSGVTYVALRQWMKDNHRISQGYVETKKLVHRFTLDQNLAQRGAQYQRNNANELSLSYVYDSYKAAGSREALNNLALAIAAGMRNRMQAPPRDVPPSNDPARRRAAAEAVAGTGRGDNNMLMSTSLRSTVERMSRTNFTIVKK